jgi:hypothetical protein
MQTMRSAISLIPIFASFALPVPLIGASGDDVLVAKLKIDIDGFLYSVDSVTATSCLLDGPDQGRPGTVSGLGFRNFYIAALGASSSALTPFFRFDLADDEAHRVRGGYAASELAFDRFASFQAELDLEVLRFPLGIISGIGLRPFVYADLVAGSRFSEPSAFAPTYSAHGADLRILLGSPVFVVASLSCGFSADGRPLFCLNID